MATSKSMEKSTNFEKKYFKIIGEIKKTNTKDIGDEQKDLAKNLMSNYGEIHKLAEYQQSDFEKFEADYSQYPTVLVAEKSIANALSNSINKIFPGRLERIGSTADGLKINSVDEFDRLFILNESDEYEIRKIPQTSIYKISKEGQVIRSRYIRAQFADAIDKHMDSDEVADLDVEHAGSNSPSYSGVRFNGPSVTVLLKMMATEEDVESFKFSQDYTIAFEIEDSKLPKTITETIQNKTKYKSQPDAKMCVVPDPLSGNWVRSTAFVEAKLFDSIPSYAPIKCAAKIAKILISKISEENLKHDMSRLAKDPQEEKDALALMSPFHMDQRKEMRYAHTFLSHTHAIEIDELPKFGISLNSTAVRHIILRKCMEEDEFKDAFNDKSDDVLVGKLVRAAFKEVSEMTKRDVPNALLRDSTIDIFSISPLTHLKVHLPTYLHILRYECRIIAEKFNMNAGAGNQPVHDSRKRPNPNECDSISVALELQNSIHCEFTAHVNDKTKPEHDAFYIKVSDGKNSTNIRVHPSTKWFTRVDKGCRYIFMNLYRTTVNDDFQFEFKENSHLCEIGSNDELTQVDTDSHTKNERRPLEDALMCPVESTVTGKIVKIGGLKYFKYRSDILKSKYVFLVDKSTTDFIKLALFEKQFENENLAEGNVIKVTWVMSTHYLNQSSPVLKATKGRSKITRVKNANLNMIDSTAAANKIRPEELVDEEEVEFTVEGINREYDIKNYNSNHSQADNNDIVVGVWIHTTHHGRITRPLEFSTLERCGFDLNRPKRGKMNDYEIRQRLHKLVPLKGVGVITEDDIKVVHFD